jgi:V/A-type H+-transporting ATPase subunit C
MKRPSRLDYAFAVGRVRAREKNLVRRNVFDKAAEEGDFPSAIRTIFSAGDFSEGLGDVADTKALDEYLERERQRLRALLDALLRDDDIMGVLDEDEQPKSAWERARDSGSSFIRDYVRHRIDLANIKIYCRVRYSGAAPERLLQLVSPGGYLDETMFLHTPGLSFSEIAEKLRSTHYHKLWSEAIEALEKRETFVALERGIEDFLMSYLQQAKRIVLGPEPVFAYGLAKKRELSLLRLVGAGKLVDVPPGILKERISATYA